MGTIDKPLLLNLGCGNNKLDGYLNVDLYGDPDLRHDLNSFPYPWDDNSVDHIEMIHTLEHIPDWWSAFCECCRILKPGCTLRIHVPDESSSDALAYRDHYHVFTRRTFDSTLNQITERSTTNAWFLEQDKAPVALIEYHVVPFAKYNWMFRFPFTWLGRFCAEHMRNFIWEQRFLFVKKG